MKIETQKCTSTPTTNRGVENADEIQNFILESIKNDDLKGNQKTPVSDNTVDSVIDWFQCVIKCDGWDEINNEVDSARALRTEVYRLIEYFGYSPDNCIYLPTGVSGYNNTYVIQSKIKILVNYNMANMGIMILLSGYACRELEQFYSWQFLFSYINNYKLNINRIDIAHDFYNFDYDIMKKVHSHINKKSITSKYKTSTIIQERFIGSDSLKGDSVRFGDRSSLVTTIFYDKLLERKQADYILPSNLQSWVRCETSYRQERGQELYNRIQNDLQESMRYESSVLYNYIDFKDMKSNNKQVCRRPTAKWWLNLVGTIEKQPLAKKAIQNSLQQKNTWINRQVCKTIAMLQIADSYYSLVGGHDNHDMNYCSTWITDVAYRGLEKINHNDLNLLNTYLHENGINVNLTKDDLKYFLIRLLKN